MKLPPGDKGAKSGQIVQFVQFVSKRTKTALFAGINETAVSHYRIQDIMARQEGIILLTGLVGGLSYYKTKRGRYFLRRKSGVSRERIMSGPAFARVRENIACFRSATLAAKLVRQAFTPLFACADHQVSSRLTGRIVKVIQGDAKNPRDRRRVMDGDLSVLEGFGINRKSNLPSILDTSYSTSIDRPTGVMVIDIPSLIPENRLAFPSGATHYRLKSGAAAIDFVNNTYSVDFSESAVLPINEDTQAPLRLTHTLPPASRDPVFLVLGIAFLRMVNGTPHPVENAAYNAMAIVKTDAIKRDDSTEDHKRDRAPRALLRRTISPTRTATPRLPALRAFRQRRVPAAGDDIFRTWVRCGSGGKVDSG